eukprot:4754901-Prymnesium_polylepis.1
MDVVAAGCMQAEAAGGLAGGLLYRSAGALVASRAAIPPRPLLTSAELRPANAPAGELAGLIVVGSYVGKSSEQLAHLLELCPWVHGVELSVKQLAGGGTAWGTEEARAREGAKLSRTPTPNWILCLWLRGLRSFLCVSLGSQGAEVDAAIEDGRSVVLFTSREL